MNRNDPPDPRTTSLPGLDPGQLRHPRSVRFSEEEWTLVQQAAVRHGLAAGEIVRSGALALAQRRSFENPPSSLSPGHIALIEATYRAVHLLATVATRPMPYDEVDTLIGEAHGALLATLDEVPVGADAGESPPAGRRQRPNKHNTSPKRFSGPIPI